VYRRALLPLLNYSMNMQQPNVGNIGTPHLIWADDIYAPQQVRIKLVLRMWFAGVGTRRHPRQAQLLHQALHPLAIDCVAAST
jgi:hypothetical protein